MILYLDTSSLLKLYVEETGTNEVQEKSGRSDAIASSVIAYPEAHAALARRHREGALSKSELKTVLEQFRETWAHFLAVFLSAPIYLRAGTLAIKYGLRGMDAIHLASWAELFKGGDRVEFLSHDQKLMKAAAKEAKR
jgi:predicted nucleic acid-binding protein